MANRFLLRSYDLQVEYNVGGNPGFTALSFTEGGNDPVNFKADQVTTASTELGELVSVPVRQTVDTGGELFGFFLPDIEVPLGQRQEFTTTGVRATFSGPDSIPHRPESWCAVELHGTAEEVEQAL
jgi:hypothetical protein